MSGNLDHAPCKVIKKALLDFGLGTEVTADDEWPIFVNHLPDTEDMDDNALCVYDTEAVIHTREMPTSEYTEDHGIQVMVRATSRSVGYAKAKAILEALDKQVNRLAVTIGVSSYVVHSMNRTSDVAYVGVEPETERRLHSINYTTTLTQTS